MGGNYKGLWPRPNWVWSTPQAQGNNNSKNEVETRRKNK